MQVSITFPSDPNVRETMKLDRKLGQGKFKVYLAKSPASSTQYALKIFSRDFALREHYARERMCMTKVDHPNIIKHVPVLSHNFRLDIILTEYAPNGDLFDFVMKGCLQNERVVRSYFHQLIEGLEHLHSQRIAHLDLKLENLLLDENYVLKIIDFDQAQATSEDKLRSFGTTGYRAPEILDRTCEDFLAADIYAAGIILFAFQAREFPFVESPDANNTELLYYDTFINNNDEFWREKEEKIGERGTFSPELKALLNGMLNKDTTQRFNIENIKRSDWYKGLVYSQEELKNEIKGVAGNESSAP